MRIVALASLLLVVAGCAPVGDPGYGVIFRNDGDVRLVIRGKTHPEGGQAATWLLPPSSAGWVLNTIGDSRFAPPIDYAIVDASSCRELIVQHVDFSLAPDPGWTEFLVTVAPGGATRLDASPNAAGDISGDLVLTELCPTK
jgi:hypothetical protein